MYAVSISNLPAGADLRKGQIIRRDTGTWVAAVATNAEAVCGNTCKTGDLVNAIVAGLAEVECATALTVGGRITCDANGRAVNTTATATHIQLGLVIEPGKAAAAGAFTYATVVLDALKVTLT
jgi:diaminopimelate decarboxylase